jgi:exopolysaccharide biosynthesis polyprenyl glycosylphosphotransferase
MLVVGSGEAAQAIIQKIQWSPYLGYDLVGVVNGDDLSQEATGASMLGTIDDLPDIIDKHDIQEVIIALPEGTKRSETIRLVSMCQRGSVAIKIFPDLFEFITTGVSIDDLAGMPLLNVRDIQLRGWKLSLKRALDIIGAGIGLVILSPVLMFLSLLIRVESPGPVFYCQERMGLDGRPFQIIKFRSMRRDAEKEGPGWTTKDDPRRTKMGQWLRQKNIDELPQLINVLLGDMSLVGPRPERPVYVQKFRQSIPRYMDRHREKAGLTGWAQVNGLRGNTSIAERTKYDLWYVENWSLWLDIKIIMRTIVSMVFGGPNNAY